MSRLSLIATTWFLAATAHAQEDGFKPLFNGKDLSGWVNVNCAPGTFFVKDGMIITTGKPTGYMRTDRHYENFIAEFDWLHAPNPKGSVGNSGFFVWCDPLPGVGSPFTRGIEVQVLVNLEWTDKKTGKPTATSHGDLFSVQSAICIPEREHPLKWARCLPSENRARGEFEWNHYRVEANDGTIKLAVNGKVVSSVSKCNPRKGYLALESEGSECRFKNLKINEMPTTNPKKEEICEVDKGFKSMLNGLDLSGWKADDEIKKHWKMSDGVLSYDGNKKGESRFLNEKDQRDYELIIDWRYSIPGEFGILPRGGKREIAFKPETGNKNAWNRTIVRLKGGQVRLQTNNKLVGEVNLERELPASGPLVLTTYHAVQFRNVFIRELKADEK